jgi:hypothetical protein
MKCLVTLCLRGEKTSREGLERHPAVAMACGRDEEYSVKPDPPSRQAHEADTGFGGRGPNI